jgi:hypothetical protein
MKSYSRALLHLAVLTLCTLTWSLMPATAQQTIPLTRATCSLGGEVSLACHWQSSDMSCTYNCTTFQAVDSGTSCSTNSSGLGTIKEVTSGSDGSVTTSTTSCYTSQSMTAQCAPAGPVVCTEVASSTIGGGGGGTCSDELCFECGCCGASSCGGSGSPIIVDTTGLGFNLTSPADGVIFDIAGDGHAVKMAWTAANAGNAFLALDRNHNGRIDNGKELFGNFTPQRGSDNRNGYLALSEYDRPENGGNGDGIIDERDAVFSRLILWIDQNHDGISQPNELHTLPEPGVYSISLKYRDDRRYFDQFGNWFHYQAALNPDPLDGESKDGRVTYDVFFLFADNTKNRGHNDEQSPARLISAAEHRLN